MLLSSDCVAAPAASAYLPPFDTSAPASAPEAADCAPVPAAVVSLALESRYAPGDLTASHAVPERQAAYERAFRPVQTFLKSVVLDANRFTLHGDRGAANGACALRHLAEWARADGLSDIQNSTAEFKLTTTLAGLALAYMQVKPMEASAQDRIDIEDWMKDRAAAVRAYVEAHPESPTTRNNQRYWSGLAVAAVGVATGSRQDFDWGMDSFRLGACDVTPEGALPMEVKRGELALDYHVYSLSPLVMLAEIGARNGVDTYGMCDGGLKRLGTFTLQQMDDPSRLEALTGEPQKPALRNGALSKSQGAWLVAYSRRFALADRWRERIADQPRLAMAETGGDQRILFDRDGGRPQ